MIKLIVIWVGHVVCMWEMSNLFRSWLATLGGVDQLGHLAVGGRIIISK
jgi:hypothetical protein